jgi:hypothetical protein
VESLGSRVRIPAGPPYFLGESRKPARPLLCQAKKRPEKIRRCPKCNSRNWKDGAKDSSRERECHTDDGHDDDDDRDAGVERLGRFLTSS